MLRRFARHVAGRDSHGITHERNFSFGCNTWLFAVIQATISTVLTKNESFRFSSEPGLFAEIQDEEERWQLWLACQTEEEIAKAVGMTQQGVGRVSQQNESFRFVVKPGLFAEIQDEAAKT